MRSGSFESGSPRDGRLGADVERGDSAGQGILLQLGQSARGQEVEHRLAVGELQDAPGQVVVGAVRVGCQRLADPRKQMAEKRQVEPAQEPPARTRELQDRDLAARPGDADHLVDAADRVAHVSQAERHAHHAEGVAGHGQALGVALHERDPPERPGLLDLGMAQDEHLAAEVGSDDRRTTPAGAVVRQGQVGRAGAAIEHGHARLGRDDPGREGPPRTIDVQAEQVVEEIVPSRDRGEHPPHPLVGLVDRERIRSAWFRCPPPDRPRPSFRPDSKHSFWKPDSGHRR